MNVAANIFKFLFSPSNTNVPMIGRSEPSAVQQRMSAARIADAPRRRALAAEIAEWNGKVKRRNQRFVARQHARGRSAA